MKIEIFGEKPATDTLRLKLVPSDSGDDTIDLIAVDANGEMQSRGRLLNISSTGINTYPYVGINVKLPKDSSDRIVVGKL